MSCSGRLQKSFCLLFTHQKIHHHHHHHHHSTCCIVGFLHSYIYTIQHVPEDGIFYLVCRQNRSLTLPLHYNTCRMEHINDKNWSLCVFSTFSTYHGPTCLLLLLVLLSFFQTATTQPHSKYFCIETPTPLPQKH